MARGFARFEMIAYVSGGPEGRKLPSGSTCSQVRVGVPWRKEGETQWDSFRVSFFGEWPALAYLVPGRQVYIAGRLSARSYQTQDGQTRYVLDLVAQELVLLGNGNGRQEQGRDAGSQPTANADPVWDEDIPF